MSNTLTPPPMTEADQNPIKKPEQYKSLYEATGNITDHNTMLVPLSTLRTQYALLERALAALRHSNPSEPIWKTPHREAIADLTAHLEPKP